MGKYWTLGETISRVCWSHLILAPNARSGDGTLDIMRYCSKENDLILCSSTLLTNAMQSGQGLLISDHEKGLLRMLIQKAGLLSLGTLASYPYPAACQPLTSSRRHRVMMSASACNVPARQSAHTVGKCAPWSHHRYSVRYLSFNQGMSGKTARWRGRGRDNP